MAYKITGNLSADARIIVLSETNMSVEHSSEHTVGEYSAEDLTNNSKIILARQADGETFGYSGVMPEEYQSGPVLPTGDDFSTGIDDWILLRTDTDGTMDWYESDSLRLSLNTGSSSEADWTKAMWIYQLDGDFDIQMDYERVSGAGVAYMYSLKVTAAGNPDPNDDFVAVRWRSDQSVMQSFYRIDGTNYGITDNSNSPDYTTPNLKFRITKSGSVFTTYHDPGTGSWQQVAQFSIPVWENTKFNPTSSVYRWGAASVSCKFSNFLVNSGTVIPPVSTNNFTDLTPGISYNIDDTILDTYYASRTDAANIVESTVNGLRMYSPANKSALIKSTKVLDSTENFSVEFSGYISLTASTGLFGLDIYSADTAFSEGFSLTGHAATGGVRLYERTAGSSVQGTGTSMSLANIKFLVAYEAATHAWTFCVNGSVWHTDTHDMLGLPVRIRMQASSWGTTIIDTDVYTLNIWGTEAAALPSVPYTDDFSTGIDDWEMYRTDTDATMDWYNSNSLRLAINTGGSTEFDYIRTPWIYGLEGDFDIEVEYKRLDLVGLGGTDVAEYGLYVVPFDSPDGDANNIRVLHIENASLMHARYELNNIAQQTIDNSTKPDPTSDNLRLRITKSGATFTTYHDIGDGEWLLVGQFTAAPFENVVMRPSFHMYRAYTVSVSAIFDNFKVNSGTLTYA